MDDHSQVLSAEYGVSFFFFRSISPCPSPPKEIRLDDVEASSANTYTR